MNVFLKNLVRVAFISIGAGILFIVVAYSMSKSIFDKISRDGLVLFGHNSIWTDWNNEELNNAEMNNDWKESTVEEKNLSSNSNLQYPNKEYKIDSIDINISLGSVDIKEGNEFNLQVNSAASNSVTSEISDGVWKIGSSSDSIQDNIAEVKITIPKDFNAKNISLKCGAGNIKAEKISTDMISISVGAGNCEIDELISKEKSFFAVGAGEIKIDDMFAYNAEFNCTMGSIIVEGILKGNNIVSCSMGTIELELEGNQEDYNYSGKCSMGTITVNNNNYSGMNQSFEKDNEAQNDIDVSCSVGTVILKISE